MLETPLYGRFQGEDRRLVFGPPAPYLILVRGVIALGAAMLLYCAYATVTGTPTPIYPQWWFLIGALVTCAGIFASLSLQSITFDLKERYYVRRQGPGILPRVTRGKLDNLDAIVAISEPNNRMMNGGVTYHLVLHWKGQAEPLMVLQQDTRQLPMGQPLNIGAAQILALGNRYAKALGVNYFDNTHFASACPIPLWS